MSFDAISSSLKLIFPSFRSIPHAQRTDATFRSSRDDAPLCVRMISTRHSAYDGRVCRRGRTFPRDPDRQPRPQRPNQGEAQDVYHADGNLLTRHSCVQTDTNAYIFRQFTCKLTQQSRPPQKSIARIASDAQTHFLLYLH